MDRIMVMAALAGSVGVLAVDAPIQLSHQITGTVIEYPVGRGETLGSIGSRLGADVAAMASLNNLSHVAKLSAGQVLHIDNRHIVPAVAGASVVINIPQRMLFLLDDNTSVQGFPVALGRPTWPTPSGPFAILTKEIDPTWDRSRRHRCPLRCPLIRLGGQEGS